MRPWPKLAEFVSPSPYGDTMSFASTADYQTQRAEAAIERLRVAVDALRNVQAGYDGYGFTGVREALDRIGPLPPLPPAEVDETERGGA